MKTVKYALVAAIVILSVACQPNNICKISGTFKVETDSLVALFCGPDDERVLVAVDTLRNQSRQFEFIDTIDTIDVPKHGLIRYIINHDGKRSLRETYCILEPGNIYLDSTAYYNTMFYLRGTPSNEAFFKYCQPIEELCDRRSDMRSTMKRDSTLTEEARNAIKAQCEEMKEEIQTKLVEGIKATWNDYPLAAARLLSYFKNFITLDVKHELLGNAPAPFLDDALVKPIWEAVNAQYNSAVGKEYIDFEMPDAEGKTVKLSDYVSQNKLTLVDFWASWCGPCKKDAPHVVKLYETYKDKGFGIVGVSLDSEADAWKKAITEWGMPWHQMSDLQAWKCAAAKLYAVKSIPATVLIDANGKIVAKDLRGEELEKKVAELLQ